MSRPRGPNSRPYRFVTGVERLAFRRLRAEGLSLEAIALQFSRSPALVAGYVRDIPVARAPSGRKSKTPFPSREEVLALRPLSYAKIAAHFNIPACQAYFIANPERYAHYRRTRNRGLKARQLQAQVEARRKLPHDP
jgi:hypothetical protein